MDKEGQNRKKREENERKRKMKPKRARKGKEVGLGAKKGILMDKKGNERLGSPQHTNHM